MTLVQQCFTNRLSVLIDEAENKWREAELGQGPASQAVAPPVRGARVAVHEAPRKGAG